MYTTILRPTTRGVYTYIYYYNSPISFTINFIIVASGHLLFDLIVHKYTIHTNYISTYVYRSLPVMTKTVKL